MTNLISYLSEKRSNLERKSLRMGANYFILKSRLLKNVSHVSFQSRSLSTLKEKKSSPLENVHWV